MEFRLVFQGTLPPHGQGTVLAKHRIRQELHPQLKTFWQQHPLLKDRFTVEPGQKSLVEQIADDHANCGFRFVPLADLNAAAALDILILLRKEPYKLINAAGDIDGRVKTLLDGLRMPQQCTEVPTGQAPAQNEDPFFVLFLDDSVVYELNVTTDQLFVPAQPQEPDRDVVAVVKVRLKSSGGDPLNIYDYG